VRAVTANGVLGSPRLATSAAGRAICDALGEEIAAWIERSLA
jgi:creatinine amidohydrolase/Fe(II)-dependent formamide hydrolase-like protein